MALRYSSREGHFYKKWPSSQLPLEKVPPKAPWDLGVDRGCAILAGAQNGPFLTIYRYKRYILEAIIW
jgi:hypothetical protein